MRGRVTRVTLQRVLDHIRHSKWPAELAVMTGDVVQDDSREAYERFRDMAGTLGMPVHCVPGNHDLRPLMRDVLDAGAFRYCAATEAADWLIAGIDSCMEGSPAGKVAGAELDRLDATIDASNAAHVLVCMHHPPIPVGSKWLDDLGLRNSAEFLRRLTASGKVRMTIFGHTHQAFEGRHENIAMIGTPSTCRQFLAGSETYAVDRKPPAYRRLELYPDGRAVTDLIWVADDEEPAEGTGAPEPEEHE